MCVGCVGQRLGPPNQDRRCCDEQHVVGGRRRGVGGLEAAKREVESEARVFRQMEMRAQVSGMLLDLHVMFLRCVGLGRLNALGYLGVFGR